MRLNLLPREHRFYELFQRDVANIAAAAELLVKLLSDPSDPASRQRAIKDLEHQGDELTHQIVRDLNRTFVTPFDREDIYSLCNGLDDVLDYIDEVSETLSLYDIKSVPGPALELGDLVLQAARQLQGALGKLQSQKNLEGHWIEVHRLENIGDQVAIRGIGELFRGGVEPIEVMKLKDLYEALESCLDKSEDVANVIEHIVIKNA